ncbi:hypothetical protein FE392_14310 [Xenorhabdus sp. 12]|uniref:Uncharacterized protein n=1 Tax=Xenorhabdus santafensis TaxID=2582833 RepID=A0ABU4SCF1_9GAMM|nr:hypothetical protein [Xenorhabdus sp. 12]MDX7988491.1 hypothetical protein [Xenorhabdus sp. 12]
MSEVNKLDQNCSLTTPDQYHVKVTIANDTVAPVGSFPWAMIQVYLRKNIRRNIWDAGTYIYGNNIGMDNQSVNQVNKEGVFAWNPQQPDMLACDWELNCMLSFDLEIGTSQYNNGGSQDWGYLTKEGNISSGESTFGTLSNLQSTLGIGNILTFILIESPIGTSGTIQLQVDTQNQPDLSSKNLEVTVDGSTFKLGSSSNATTDFTFNSNGAKKLGELLKQNVGNTLHFCFNWK